MIYLDNNATTLCLPEVVEAMMPYFSEEFSNASSEHIGGWSVMSAVEESKNLMAQLLGVPSNSLVYTSGATESINMIIKSAFFDYGNKKKEIITLKTEHKAVLETCIWLEKQGAIIHYASVDEHGIIDLNHLKELIHSETLLVSVMYANNETGCLQPIEEISKICKIHNVPLFSDATQTLGKIDLDGFFDRVDYACFSAHKCYGPKGIGLAYLNPRCNFPISSFIHGGSQQKGMRGGTLNAPLIIGMGKAVQRILKQIDTHQTQYLKLRKQLEQGLLAIPETKLNSSAPERLPNTVNISFKGVDGSLLMQSLQTKLGVSNGSACNAAAVLPSHVLTAMGVAPELAMASLRFGIGVQNTPEEIEKAIALVVNTVEKLRADNIQWPN